jgi:peroxiredoxin
LGLILLVTWCGLPAVGQVAIADLLGALNLSDYPSGMRPPPFNSNTPTGQTVALADLRGRVVLLTFWTTWCAECRPEMPLFEHLHRDFATQGLAVLGVNVREGTGAIAQFAQELGLTFPLVVDLQGRITTAYGVLGLPTTFLIGRDERAGALATGPREWGSAPARTLIQTLLAEPVERQEAP